MTSIDIKYQIWKFGVVFTDGVSKPIFTVLYIAQYTILCSPILYYPILYEHDLTSKN